MGIPGYCKWLESRFPEAFQRRQRVDADHVYVDANSLMVCPPTVLFLPVSFAPTPAAPPQPKQMAS